MASLLHPIDTISGEGAIEAVLTAKLVSIYSDLDTLDRSQGPFSFIASFESTQFIRFEDGISLLGLDVLAILSYSSTFLKTLLLESDYLYYKLLRDTYVHRYSIHAFAWTRNISFALDYDSSPLRARYGPLPDYNYLRPMQHLPLEANHPHEVYLTLQGTLARSLFNDNPIKNIKTCEHDPQNFLQHAASEGWPLQESFLTNPQFLCVPPETLPWEPQEPIIEIREYPSFKGGQLNRGVRTLSPISAGQLLGEYMGVFIAYDTQEEFGDETYAMEFSFAKTTLGNGKENNKNNSAGKRTPKKGRTKEIMIRINREEKPIATVISGERGNWTRFLNHKGGKEENCLFRNELLGGKRRITVRAIRDIEFGEELTVCYGDKYWGEGEEIPC